MRALLRALCSSRVSSIFFCQFNRPTEAPNRAIVNKFRIKFTLLDIKSPTRFRRVRTEENIAVVSASLNDWPSIINSMQNCRFWNEDQPEALQKLAMHPGKVRVWCGLCTKHIGLGNLANNFCRNCRDEEETIHIHWEHARHYCK